MAKTKQADKPATDSDNLERLTSAVEKLAGEVGILREIVDRLQDDLAWALNNDVFRREHYHREPVPPMQLTSVPLDPRAPDWNERINSFRPDDFMEEDEIDDHDEAEEVAQQDLFSR